jgi:hypothetical protein
MDSAGSEQGSYEQDNEPSSSIRGGEFLEQLSDNQLLHGLSYIIVMKSTGLYSTV